MKATVANMQKLCLKHDQPIAVPGVVAYSHETGETSSASPGDYFLMEPNECLKDAEGNEMVLVKKIETVVMQEMDDD